MTVNAVWDVTDARRQAIIIALQTITEQYAVQRVYLAWPEAKDAAQRNIDLLLAAREELRAMLDENEPEGGENRQTELVDKGAELRRLLESATAASQAQQWGNLPRDVEPKAVRAWFADHRTAIRREMSIPDRIELGQAVDWAEVLLILEKAISKKVSA